MPLLLGHGTWWECEVSAVGSGFLREVGVDACKLERACGGCLGTKRRRRACKTAKSLGELSKEL
jgi:hypothetical protein